MLPTYAEGYVNAAKSAEGSPARREAAAAAAYHLGRGTYGHRWELVLSGVLNGSPDCVVLGFRLGRGPS